MLNSGLHCLESESLQPFKDTNTQIQKTNASTKYKHLSTNTQYKRKCKLQTQINLDDMMLSSRLDCANHFRRAFNESHLDPAFVEL